MANLWQVTYAAPAAIRGQRSGLNWPSLISWGKGVVGTSSQNHGTVGSTLGLPETLHWDQVTHLALMDEWVQYAKKGWWTRETGSRHIYGEWIFMGIESAWIYAKLSGRTRLTEDLRKNIRSSLAMMALSAAPVKGGRYPGPRVCLTGSRSAISDKVNGSRFEPNGGPTPVMFLEDNPLDYRLGRYLGLSPRNGLWLDDQWRAYQAEHGFTPFEALSAAERRVLDSVASGSLDKITTLLGWLAEGPLPIVPMRFLRYTNGVGCFIEKSISPNSTPTQYAHFWYKQKTGAGWWRDVSWSPDHLIWLAVDDYRYRSQGVSGVCKRDGDRLLAQTVDRKDYWDETTRKAKSGWKAMPLPDGDLLYDIRVDNKGVYWLEGEGATPPPEPPEEGGEEGSKGARSKIRRNLSRMSNADAKLLRVIQKRLLQ